MNQNRAKSPEFLQGYRYAKLSPTLAKTLYADTDIKDIINVLENQPGPYAEIARGMAAYYRECAEQRIAADVGKRIDEKEPPDRRF